MMRILSTILAMMFCISVLHAKGSCDITQFRYECDIELHAKKSRAYPSMVTCGSRYGFVTVEEYEVLKRYQRSNINIILMVNGVFADAPCVPSARFL